jgi:hypothetical protein
MSAPSQPRSKDTMANLAQPAGSWFPRCAVALALLVGTAAQAAGTPGRRVALVIGNGSYQQADLPKLSNPPNDAEDMARVLRGFGFEVIERKDQTLQGMNQAIAEFGSRLGGSEAALFYYAGHGLQVKNQNYLLPINAAIESEASVPYQGVNLNQVLDEMENGKSGVNIVMLDACRNNPITGKFRSARTRGLASPGPTPKGTVIVYATDPGNVASDGTGRNGLFTAGLLTAFKGSDLSLDGVLTVASAEVEQASHQTQTPYVDGPKTLQKTFHFRVTIDPGQKEIERTYWTSIEKSSDPADFEAYLKRYPDGSYADLAANRLKALGGQSPKAAAPSSAAPAAAGASVFDGHWSVAVVCEDVQKLGRSARGYKLNFFADVKDGQLRAQSGQAGQPGSLAMAGTIQPDGSAELHVTGLTSNPEVAFGSRSGMPYSYTMRGSFTKNLGKTKRVELRPCEATLVRVE